MTANRDTRNMNPVADHAIATRYKALEAMPLVYAAKAMGMGVRALEGALSRTHTPRAQKAVVAVEPWVEGRDSAFPLRAGHPQTWGLLNRGLSIEGAEYPR